MLGPNEETDQYSPGALKAVLLSLPSQSFIGDLDEAALAELDRNVERCCVAAGATLSRQGDAAHDMYIVTAGRLGVFVNVGLGERIVAQIRSGELVGEMSLISDEPRSATVVALRNTELIRIPARAAGSARVIVATLAAPSTRTASPK
jgi:NTE family protein